MKKCSTCNTPKPITEYSWKRKDRGERSARCKSCQKLASNQHYRENKRTYFKRNKEERLRTRTERMRLKDRPCADCKVKYDPWVMQFDHLENKRYNVSKIRSMTTLATEAEKCDVVCANCHAIRTHNRLHASIV